MVREEIVQYYGASAAAIQEVYPGVALGRFRTAGQEEGKTATRAGVGPGPEEPVVLFVGSGFARKGLRFLLEAVSLMKGMKDLRARLLVKGSLGPFQSQAARLGMADRVHSAGAVADPERWMAVADRFALPTVYDSFANASLEAVAAGLPVVTSRTNGVTEILTSGTDRHNLDDSPTVTGLAKILRELTNAGLRRAIGQAARGTALPSPSRTTASGTLKTYCAIRAEG